MRNLSIGASALLLVIAAFSRVAGQQPLPQSGPSPVAGTGAISGVVVDGSTNTPLAGVIVFLGPANRQSIGQPLNQLTDDKGRFVFTNLGSVSDGYYINATKFGYTVGHYGRGTGRQIPLTDGEWFADARVVLYRSSAISGTVTDEFGDPVIGAYVRVLTQVTVGGGSHLATGPVAKTDDRGAYRIANLAAGKYVVNVPIVQVAVTPERAATPLTSGAASPEPSLEVDSATRQVLGRYPMPRPRADGRPQIYAPAFFPSVATPGDAQVIDLKNAEDRQNVDIHLKPVSVVSVSGTVAGPPDALAGLRLRLLAAGSEELGDGSETATTMVGANSAFTFARVPTGHYTIEARWAASEFTLLTDTLIAPPPVSLPLAPNALNLSALSPSMDTVAPRYQTSRQMPPAYWGRARVDVADRDITDVAVTMQRGVTISGRGVADDPSAGLRVAGLAIRISLEPADGNVAMSATPNVSVGLPADLVSAETFQIEGVMPGQHFLRIVGRTVKSVVWNGRDMTNTPFNTAEGHDFTDVVVTFTNKTTTLMGTVRDDQGRPATDAIVIAFPVEREQWTNNGLLPPGFSVTTPGDGGMFRQTNLPAGEYFVTAIGSDEPDWRNPKFLQAASALAARVTLDWGETKTVDMKRIQVQVR
jgi:hypothetical protein